MTTTSISRAKCYVILQGLEQSLAETLKRKFDWGNEELLNDAEKEKAIGRLREDLGDRNWGISDVPADDLIQYLDLGDLVGLLNRHVGRIRDVQPDHVRSATALMERYQLLSIRKRVMHPVRPLEPLDLPTLLQAAAAIPKKAYSLIWAPLKEGVTLVSENAGVLDVSIPHYWAEDPPIINNLPAAEFDDTGFIGRSRERGQLKRLLESDHRIITVVGEGGKGKTALALRVCNDLIEGSPSLFDRIVWVSLKTRYLSPEGIREIKEAVDSTGALIDVIMDSLKGLAQAEDGRWETVLDRLRKEKTLLVIDNLETIGNEIRDLLLEVPVGSKVLMTSRVGLGELEIRYELPDFAPGDATKLFRSLVSAYGYKALRGWQDDIVAKRCGSLYSNPLLIKWFVQAVGRGSDPDSLISKSRDFDEALEFCYANVYEKLSTVSKDLLAYLMAARRKLTRAQLQELAGIGYTEFTRAYQDLVRSSFVEREFSEEGTQSFQITGLVSEYLSRKYPPSDDVLRRIRQQLKEWTTVQEASLVRSTTYRYGGYVHVSNADERIAATHVMRSTRAARSGDFQAAADALETAEQLMPNWWEIFRIKAEILEQQRKPIYEIEAAYEQSLKCNDNDINRYHYAVYLMREGDHERALEMIQGALEHEQADPETLRSVRGLILVRQGRIVEGIEDLKFAWAADAENAPIKVNRVRGTQLADAYRRRAEQLASLGRKEEALESLCMAAEVADAAIRKFGCDPKIAEAAINVVRAGEYIGFRGTTFQSTIEDYARNWDQNLQFVNCTRGFRDTLSHFRRQPRMADLLPNAAKTAMSFDYTSRFQGRVRMIDLYRRFGLIASPGIGDVYFNRWSLASPEVWPELRLGTEVSFGVLPQPTKPNPHAVALEVAGSAGPDR